MTENTCPKCGHDIKDSSAQYCPSCGVRLGSEAASIITDIRPHYAGFLERLIAWIIDMIILALINGIVIGILVAIWIFSAIIPGVTEKTLGQNPGSFISIFLGAYLVIVVVSIIITWLYYALMESSRHQGTLGKIILHLRVTNLNGDRISFGRATLRFIGRFFCHITFGIGYLLIIFTEKKQGLHDMIASTLVMQD